MLFLSLLGKDDIPRELGLTLRGALLVSNMTAYYEDDDLGYHDDDLGDHDDFVEFAFRAHKL